MTKNVPTIITHGNKPFTFTYKDSSCVVFTDSKARPLSRNDLEEIARLHRRFYLRTTGCAMCIIGVAFLVVYLIH